MKIVLDAFGGDYAPLEICKGAILALKEYSDLTLVLSGNEETLKKVVLELKKDKQYASFDESRLEFLPASEVISNDDKPTDAIRTKKDSSLVRALDLLKADDSVKAVISAGSTGAVLTGGFMKIGRIKGVSRPALCVAVPTLSGNPTVLLDCGANMDSKPINLIHFALMGSSYYESLFGKKQPSVALLSVGTEDEKGNELVKKTLPYLKTLPINFVGNMEARDFLTGKYDVVVADGFAGNTLLKSSEGAISLVIKLLKSSIKTGGPSTKIGGLLIKKSLKKTLKKFDYSNYGGSPFLGLNKTVIKAHGNSKAKNIFECISQAKNMDNSNLNEAIKRILEQNPISIVE